MKYMFQYHAVANVIKNFIIYLLYFFFTETTTNPSFDAQAR